MRGARHRRLWRATLAALSQAKRVGSPLLRLARVPGVCPLRARNSHLLAEDPRVDRAVEGARAPISVHFHPSEGLPVQQALCCLEKELAVLA